MLQCVSFDSFLISALGGDHLRSALIPLYHKSVNYPYGIIPKRTLYRKMGYVILDNFFSFEQKRFFSEKLPIFLIPVHSTGSKVRNSDRSEKLHVIVYILYIKITLIVLKGDFCLFSWPVPIHLELFKNRKLKLGNKLVKRFVE